MKIILNKEIAKEMPNSQALGSFNSAANLLGAGVGFSLPGNVTLTKENGYLVGRQNGNKVASEKYSSKALSRIIKKK
jgi:hypothetical protein